MKKILSVLLSVSLVLGCMSCLLWGSPVSAAEVSRGNYDFEGLTEYDLSNLVKTENCTAEIDTSWKLSSESALKVTLPAKQNELGHIVFSNLALQAGRTYKVSLKMKITTENPTYVYAGLYSGTSARSAAQILAFDRWKPGNTYESNAGAKLLTATGTNYTFSGSFTADETGSFYLSAWNNDTDEAVKLYLDDLVITEDVETKTVTLHQNDGTDTTTTVACEVGSALNVEEPTRTGYKFNGWFTDEACTAAFNGIVTSNIDLYAGWKQYFTYGFNSVVSVAPSTFGRTDNLADIVSDTFVENPLNSNDTSSLHYKLESVSGNMFIMLTKGNASYKLSANKEYKFSLWLKTESEFTGNIGGVSGGIYDPPAGELFNLTVDASLANGEWQKIEGYFTPNSDGYAKLVVWATDAIKGKPIEFYLDNLVVEEALTPTEIEAAVTKNFEFKGTSIRTTGNQALRFKTQVNKSVLEADYSGYQIVEYGFLAFRADYMDEGSDLTVDTQITRNGKTIKALQKPAYVKNKQDIIFSETESEKLFTAALYNIKAENYGVDYAVRTYAVLQGLNGNKVTVYVTETQAYSVNATAEARFAAIGNTYTDVEGKSWAESYETRVYLYENILSKIVGGNFTAPAAANS